MIKVHQNPNVKKERAIIMKKKYQGRNLMNMLDDVKTDEDEQAVIDEVIENTNDEDEQPVIDDTNDEVNDDTTDYDYANMSSEEISKALAVSSKSFITTHGTFGSEENHKMKTAKLDKLMKTLAKSDEFREEIAQRTTPLPVILAVGVLIRATSEGLIADFPEVKKHLDTLSDGDKSLAEEFTHYLKAMSFDIGTVRVKELTNVSLYDFIYRSHGESESASEKLQEKRILSTSPLQHNFLPYDEILADDSSGRAEIDVQSSISDEELKILEEFGATKYLSATGRVGWTEMMADSRRELAQRQADENDDLSDFFPEWKREQRTFESASELERLKRDHGHKVEQGYAKDMELEKWSVTFEDSESSALPGYLISGYREKIWFNELDGQYYIKLSEDEDKWDYYLNDYLMENNRGLTDSLLAQVYASISNRWKLPKAFTNQRLFSAVHIYAKDYNGKNPIEETLTLYDKAVKEGKVEPIEEYEHEKYIDSLGELRESYARDSLKYLFRKIIIKNQTNDTEMYEDQEAVIFAGPQGIGKSKVSQLLGLGYYTEDIDLTKRLTEDSHARDALMRLAYSAVAIMDEVGDKEHSSRKNLDALKANIQKRHFKARAPYARTDSQLYFRGVVIGTTNVPNFLKDSTGNRRFEPIWLEQLPWTTQEDIVRVLHSAREEMLDIMTEGGYKKLSQVKHRFTLEEMRSHESEKMMYYGSTMPVSALYEAVMYDIFSQDSRIEGLGLTYGENRNGKFVHLGSTSVVEWSRFWQKFIGDRNGKLRYYERVGDVTEQIIFEETKNKYAGENFRETVIEPLGLTRIQVNGRKIYGIYLEEMKTKWPVVFRSEFDAKYIKENKSPGMGSGKVEHIGMFSTIHGK